MKFTGPRKKLVDSLINNINHKFKFEFESEIYLVAALLDVSNLRKWAKRSFGQTFLKNLLLHWFQ